MARGGAEREMRREFASREKLETYLREQFPEAAARGGGLSAARGGRAAAERALEAYDPRGYGETRNYLDGNVTRLSAYLRHGVLGLRETLERLAEKAGGLERMRKLAQELAWRDYWQRVWREIGDGVWEDREPYKTGWAAEDYADELPPDVEEGATGLECMDRFARELVETGYLHNHARMWVASYTTHWRRTKWQAGARWFLSHLTDGDTASNNLSWQWVASTFSAKPYIFNRENLEKYTRGRYCGTCAARESCPFEGSYGELAERLFNPRGGAR